MAIIAVVDRRGPQQPCPLKTIEVDNLDEWVEIQTKSLKEIMSENVWWFDCYGNFCTKHGHLAPAHFADLGMTFSVKKGCGFSLPETKWLRHVDKNGTIE